MNSICWWLSPIGCSSAIWCRQTKSSHLQIWDKLSNRLSNVSQASSFLSVVASESVSKPPHWHAFSFVRVALKMQLPWEHSTPAGPIHSVWFFLPLPTTLILGYHNLCREKPCQGQILIFGLNQCSLSGAGVPQWDSYRSYQEKQKETLLWASWPRTWNLP